MSVKTTGPLLEFSEHVETLMEGLSAAVFVGDDLWVACDELTSVERLSPDGCGGFGGQRSFELHGPLKLPAFGEKKIDQEIDIEGLDFADGYLWLVGSHSVKRKKLSAGKHKNDTDEENIDRLRKTEAEGNRYLLARVPVVRDDETGESVLAAASADGTLTAAQLPCTLTDSALTRAVLADDEDGKPDRHLAPWLRLPGKDNGFDIEGLAVAGGRVFLGLRSPVLRGWAVVLELSVEGGAGGELRLKKIGPKGRAYRKHFLDLGGLGVRSVNADGDDLLVIAGPPLTHDGPVRVFRWEGGAAVGAESVVWADELGGPVLVVPHGEGADRAEGMVLVPGTKPPAVLVVYDAPSEARKVGGRAVRADIFDLS
ncbi:MAG TPA: DUF3616 domain-containing protein [Pyrinomonadaceae bacterium]